jgi:hypothetical protein
MLEMVNSFCSAVLHYFNIPLRGVYVLMPKASLLVCSENNGRGSIHLMGDFDWPIPLLEWSDRVCCHAPLCHYVQISNTMLSDAEGCIKWMEQRDATTLAQKMEHQ